MEAKENEILVTKKKALFFTSDVSIRKVLLLTPWASGITGQVLGGKLFGSKWGVGVATDTSFWLLFSDSLKLNGYGIGIYFNLLHVGSDRYSFSGRVRSPRATLYTLKPLAL